MMDGVEVSVMGWSSTLVNVSPCTRPSCFEEQSCVYQSQCVLASSTNFLVLMCAARCGHCARRSESGMALGMMSLQSSHLTHAWSSTTLCHVTPCVFLSSEPWLKQCSFKKCSLCLRNEWIHRKSVCLCENRPQWFHKSALKVHMIHCDSSAALAPVCLL